MAIFDRLGIKVIAGVGLCGAAMALSPDAAAMSLKTGGYSCVQGIAGETAPAAVAGGPAGAPVPAGAGAPVPVGAPVGLPVGAPVIAGAPAPGGALLTGVGGLAGKDAPTGATPTGGPAPGQPILPGPPA